MLTIELRALAQRLEDESPFKPRKGSAADIMRQAADELERKDALLFEATARTERLDQGLTHAKERLIELLRARDAVRKAYEQSLHHLLTLGNHI